MDLFQELADKIEKGDSAGTVELVEKALADNIPAGDILNNGLISGMNSIGIKFRNNEVFIPEVLVAARAMKGALEILKPHLAAAKVESKGKILVGTVKGDLHDIGKNIVVIMLEGAGFDVIDLGIDVSKEQFLDGISKENPSLIGLSALLTTTMPYMKDIIAAIRESGNDGVKVMIGGAPVTENFASEIGADGYAPDASTAVDLATSLV